MFAASLRKVNMPVPASKNWVQPSARLHMISTSNIVVTECHSCHAKWHFVSRRYDCVWESCVCVSELWVVSCVWIVCVWASCVWVSCVWESCVWGSCVWESCVCVRELCVKELCVSKLCVCVSKLCVWASCVCVWVICVCVSKLCVRELCVWGKCVRELCVWVSCVCVRELCVCVRELWVVSCVWVGRREEAVRTRVRNQKQEPHTKMWGTIQGKILVLLIYPICFLEITQHVARSYMEPIKYVAHFKETPSLSASQQEPKGEFSLNCPCW